MNPFNRKKKASTDILTIKTEQLDAVTKEAENAVSMVSTAMNRMRLASQKMKNHMEDIDAYCSSLMAVREQLDKNYAHNEAVIANFSKLLCEEGNN
jgi:uncharacterized protein YigA (DUF484 family)